MAGKTYLGFEEKYLSKHFESEYVAYHNNLKSLGELQRKLLPSHYASIRMPRKEIAHYRSLEMVNGSEVTLRQFIEAAAGEDPANVTISPSRDSNDDIEGYYLQVTEFAPNPRYEDQLKIYNADLANDKESRAKIAVVEKRLLELSDIFDTALAKLL